MKIILSIILTAIICYFTQIYIPVWWIFAPVCFLIAIFIQLKSSWRHFFSGLIPVMAVWLALFYIADKPNDSILSNKIAALFSMPNQHILFIVAALIMGLIGGLAAVAGSALRRKK